jgi:hypothetical protein
MGGIRLARIGDALRRKPGEDVGDLLVGHRLWAVSSPIRFSFVGAACDDDAAQVLVADERKIGGVDDGPEFALSGGGISIGGAAFTARSVATSAKNLIGLKSMICIAG